MKKQAMLVAFDEFTARMAGRYAQARTKLEAGDYAGAHQVLANIALSHAKTAMSLRNVLIKDGLLEEDKR